MGEPESQARSQNPRIGGGEEGGGGGRGDRVQIFNLFSLCGMRWGAAQVPRQERQGGDFQEHPLA